MRIKVPQLELRPCSGVFNLAGERGIDGARVNAETGEAMRREQEARAWQQGMQRKLADCPGFLGSLLPGEQTPGRVAVQPGAAVRL